MFLGIKICFDFFIWEIEVWPKKSYNKTSLLGGKSFFTSPSAVQFFIYPFNAIVLMRRIYAIKGHIHTKLHGR